MTQRARGRLLDVLSRHEKAILDEWMRLQSEALTRRRDLVSDEELARESAAFLSAFRTAAATDTDIRGASWAEVRELLTELSARRARLGMSPIDTATFVFSLKRPIFDRLRQEAGSDAQAFADEVWNTTVLLDALGLYTTEVHQTNRESVIVRQQQELLELSTPVVRLWDGVLGLPLIGTLDSARTQVVMESLLQQIVQTGASVAIIDITGVPTVDTLVAQHLLKTVAAARLMGADCIISGIRPQIAQTIVHLGVELGDVTTKSSMADALILALRRIGYSVQRDPQAG